MAKIGSQKTRNKVLLLNSLTRCFKLIKDDMPPVIVAEELRLIFIRGCAYTGEIVMIKMFEGLMELYKLSQGLCPQCEGDNPNTIPRAHMCAECRAQSQIDAGDTDDIPQA